MSETETKVKTTVKILPQYDRVLLTPITAADRTEGGIIIPETAKQPPKEGVVVAVGDGRLMEDGAILPLRVQVGDRVLFVEGRETPLEVNHQNFLVVRDDDIIAILVYEEVAVEEPKLLLDENGAPPPQGARGKVKPLVAMPDDRTPGEIKL